MVFSTSIKLHSARKDAKIKIVKETSSIKILQMRPFLVALLLFIAIATVESNSEGDALHAWKTKLNDPNNVLQSWDPMLVNPCTWLNITCNSDNSVVRVDLGEAGLAGPLVPELGWLVNLQYLQVERNHLSGEIPRALGNLTKLVSLGLGHNQLTGPIPDTLGNLRFLRFLRLNSNKLTGKIPFQVIQLIQWGKLQIMNVSDNQLSGTVHHTNIIGFVTTTIIQDARA